MSIFKVQLNEGVGRTAQGYLDVDLVSGNSVQRTIYAPGPNKINRILKDGATFTDVNYWKRFTYPTLPYDQAFIAVVSDDGSIWSDYQIQNTVPESVTLVVTAGTTYTLAVNVINVLSLYGAPAIFTQITNTTTNSTVNVRINGTAIIPVVGGTAQIFQKGDLAITKIEFDNSNSGAITATVNVFMSVQAVPGS